MSMPETPSVEERHYRILLKAGRLFNDVLDLPQLLVAVRDFVRDAVDATGVSLLWLADGTRTGRYIVLWNHVQVEAPVIVDPLERRFVKDVIADRRPLLLDDVSRRADYKPRYSREAGLELGPLAVVPLVRGGKLHGVLEAARGPGDRPFAEDAAELLQALGEDIVLSTSNAYLYDRLRKVSAEYRLLMSIGMDLGSALGVQELLRRILDHLSEIVPYDAAGIYLRDPDVRTIEWLDHRGYPGDVEEPLHLQAGEGIVGLVIESGQPIIVDDVHAHPNYVVARPTTRSEMVVPIRSGSGDEHRVIGAFNVESDRPRAFTSRHRERLEAFAGMASATIEREQARQLRQDVERLDRELAVARKIQEYFLPRSMPLIRGFDLWGVQRSSIEVSGDYYDVIPISDHDHGVVMADVSGKGVPAALIMASLRAGLISEVRNIYSIREVIGRVNQFLVDSIETEAFVTAFYGVLNDRDRSLTFVNAGHDYPLWYRPGRGARWLRTGGTILGAFTDVSYREERIVLERGDVVVLYTDGITDSRRSGAGEDRVDDDDFYGPRRLLDVASRMAERPAREIGEAILADVDRFAGPDARDDDQTLFVIRVP